MSPASSYEVTTLLRPRAAVGRHQGVRPTSHSQGTFGPRGRGSGRSEASPTAILQDTYSVEGIFSEVHSPLWHEEEVGRVVAMAQCSTIFPSVMRYMSMARTSTRLPVGAIPSNSPKWVPRMVTRAATLSPSAIMSSTVTRTSGKTVRSPDRREV